MVSESLPLLLLEALTEALNELVQFQSMTAQELFDVLHTLQAVRLRHAELGRAGVYLYRPGDAQNAVALLLVIIEGFFKEDLHR